MKIFGLEIRRAPLAPVGDSRGGWFPLVREPFTGAWQRNQEISTDSVLAHHAVYACVTRIAQDVGKLRPKLVEQDADSGIWREVTNTAHSPALRRPNRYQNHIQFKESWVTSKLIHGNTYILLRRDARRVVDAMYVLDPSRVRVLVAPDGAVFYELSQDSLSEVGEGAPAVPASEIVHDRLNCLFHPLVGVSPIFACGAAAGVGLAIEGNSSAFFGNGSNPSGILSSPVTITAQKSRELSEIWESQYGGANTGRVAVLGDGMKFEAMRMSAVDSQLIDQLRWSAETVCSTFHVPAWKIGVAPMPAYTNPEIANQTYYSDCLQAHIEAMELCLDEALGIGKTTGVELDLEGLLRMDTATQVKTLAEGIGGSLYTIDEARAKVDLPPLKGGDTVYMQQQNYSLAALAERDREKPFAKPEPAPPPMPAEEPVVEAVIAEDDPEEARAAEMHQRSAWHARTLRVRMATR